MRNEAYLEIAFRRGLNNRFMRPVPCCGIHQYLVQLVVLLCGETFAKSDDLNTTLWRCHCDTIYYQVYLSS